MLESVRAMAADGAHRAELDVLEGNPAVRMYGELGLKSVLVEDRYELELS